jgi:hypothetical protein
VLDAMTVEVLLDEPPLHWLRVEMGAPVGRQVIEAALHRAGARLRYVASAHHPDMRLAPRLGSGRRRRFDGSGWPTRRPVARLVPTGKRAAWFLGPAGVRVDRRWCGSGAGARLAVIDDDVADVHHLDVDRVVHVGVRRPAAASGHGALMASWAAGATGTGFVGVAPDASVRMYCIPKAGTDVVSLPLAMVRAVLAGADVVVCAAYVEGSTSPMLDDALQLAARYGRRGRGTAVVLPTGRETSSPRNSLHASLSLSLAAPASDPRVHCVAPSGRSGGWFLWTDRRGKVRPFANRGPAVRWLTPGDDLEYPLGSRDRLFHAESSGASAIAAGVYALIFAANPTLELRDLHVLLSRTVTAPEPVDSSRSPADAADVLPWGRDPDGHDAKCGYGRIDASSACLGARDPVSLVLTAIGEVSAAEAWCSLAEGRPYSSALGLWASRTLLRRADLEHALRAIARHARLVALAPSRAAAHPRGALARQLALVLRELATAGGAASAVRAELRRMVGALQQASDTVEPASWVFEAAAMRVVKEMWSTHAGPSVVSVAAAPA